MEYNLVAHVGYPKAGSSTLQKKLFSNHPDLINLGLYPTANIGNDGISGDVRSTVASQIPYISDKRIPLLYKQLAQSAGLKFEEEEAKKLWDSILNDHIYSEHDKNNTVVVSHESLTSGRFSNPEIVEKARRVRSVFGDARILIMIRSQQEMLKSLYRDHPFDPRTIEYRRRPVNFPEWLEIDLNRGFLSLSHTLLFDSMTRVYENLFGSENVMVIPLEMLRHDFKSTVDALSSFLNVDANKTFELLQGEPENTGLSAAGNSYRKVRATIAPFLRWLHPIKRPLKKVDEFLFSQLKKKGGTESIVIPEIYQKKLSDLYSQDNARLSKRRSLFLQNLGYY